MKRIAAWQRISVWTILWCLPLIVHAQPADWNWTPTSASGTMLGQATINGTPAAASDWMGAFDASGVCAGAAQVILNDGLAYFNLPIYGDDATTPDADEGITGGEAFELRIWQALTNAEGVYPNADSPESFSSWANTNGAPIPTYSDPSVIYDFALDIVPYIVCPASTCLDGFVQTLEWGPAGGAISGPGVTGVYWDPASAGVGMHTLIYVLGTDTASCSVEVTPTPDATIVTEGPFCANDGPILLEAATAGGTWTGAGVLGAFFDPTTVAAGTYTIDYAVGEGVCSSTASATWTVYPAPDMPNIGIGGESLVADNTGVAANTIQWYTASGELVEGATDLLFATPVDGQAYTVLVTNGYGCSTMSAPFTFISTGVAHASPSDWRVWLDPHGALQSNQSLDEVHWMDLTGRHIAAPEKGTYLIARVRSGNQWQTLRMVWEE